MFLSTVTEEDLDLSVIARVGKFNDEFIAPVSRNTQTYIVKIDENTVCVDRTRAMRCGLLTVVAVANICTRSSTGPPRRRTPIAHNICQHGSSRIQRSVACESRGFKSDWSSISGRRRCSTTLDVQKARMATLEKPEDKTRAKGSSGIRLPCP